MLSLSEFVSNYKDLSTEFSDGLSMEFLNSKILRAEFSDSVSTKFKNFVRESVSKCKLCQAEMNVLVEIHSQKVKRCQTDLKTNFKNLSKNSALSKCENLSKPKLKNKNSKTISNSSALSHPESLSSRQNSQIESFVKKPIVFQVATEIWPITFRIHAGRALKHFRLYNEMLPDLTGIRSCCEFFPGVNRKKKLTVLTGKNVFSLVKIYCR